MDSTTNEAMQTPAKQYPMLRDSRQVVRVNVYQYLWADTLGSLLHPEISQKDVKRVADVGTATGLWLCDLNGRMPDLAQLDGFDIASESFIRPRDLPPKTSLQTLDATGPVPDSLKGKYDVVHIRLIQPGLQDGPSSVISHCLDLLRPGGYLQWEEFDVTKINLHVEDDVSRPSNLETVAGMPASAGKSGWVENLTQFMEEQGMQVKAVERRHVAPHHRLTMSLMICQVVTEITYAALDVNGPPGLGDQVRAQVAAASEEALRGSYAGYLAQMVLAQKPL